MPGKPRGRKRKVEEGGDEEDELEEDEAGSGVEGHQAKGRKAKPKQKGQQPKGKAKGKAAPKKPCRPKGVAEKKPKGVSKDHASKKVASKPGEEDAAGQKRSGNAKTTEQKARYSRKSAAYVSARKAAKDAGMDDETAKELAREVSGRQSWMT